MNGSQNSGNPVRTGSSLAVQHREYLADRAVADEVIADRGYRTVDTKVGLSRHGFSAAQARS